MSRRRFGVGIDVGGTFTDLVAIDGEGSALLDKVPTTPRDQSIGVMNGIEGLAAQADLDVGGFLAGIDFIVHGTTVVTNIMLEMTGATTGVLATRGHRDTIDVRRNHKEADFDIRLPPPYPIAPRRRRAPVTERVDAGGEVLIPLEEDDVRRGVEVLLAQEVEAIAVCYLFSFLNPRHELRTREIIREIAPDIYVSLSHEVLPRVREFERLSTTLVDAFVTPGLRRYLTNLDRTLTEEGFSGELFAMAANGGMVSIDLASRHGVQLVLSGPAGGIVASIDEGRANGVEDLITVDMGGTSFDVCLVKGGEPDISTEEWINRYQVAIPTLDIQTFGAGGGSIAWVDEGGKLRVGPQSAGADPGPACYGRGGELPTVTDADLYLGLMGAESFLGGTLTLDLDAAEQAIRRHVADPLGVDVEQAATGIVRVVNSNMANGIAEVSMKRGYDPRDLTIVAFGGAGPVHAGRLAQHLAINRVLVPRDMASVFSALGCVRSDLRVSKARGMYARSSNLGPAEIAAIDAMLRETLGEAKRDLDNVPSVTSTRVDVSFEMHYKVQTHEIMIPASFEFENGEVMISKDSMGETLARFHDLHMNLFTFNKPETEVEILGMQVDYWGLREKPELHVSHISQLPATAAPGDGTNPTGHRAVYFEEYDGFHPDTPVFDGGSLPIGAEVEGPAIVEEPNTTVVVYPGMRLSLIRDSSYELTVE